MWSNRCVYILLPVLVYAFCFGLLEWTFHIHKLLPSAVHSNITSRELTGRGWQAARQGNMSYDTPVDGYNSYPVVNKGVNTAMLSKSDQITEGSFNTMEKYAFVHTPDVLPIPQNVNKVIYKPTKEPLKGLFSPMHKYTNANMLSPQIKNETIETMIRMLDEPISKAPMATDDKVSVTSTHAFTTTTSAVKVTSTRKEVASLEKDKQTRQGGRTFYGSKLHDKYYLTDAARDQLSIYGREDLMDTSRNCSQRPPQCIIIGVMKAGTEAFTRYLLLHPRIAMQISMQSTMFFTQNYQYGWNWYLHQMMCSSESQVSMEKSPQYFISGVAMQRIKQHLPDVKIIIMVRDPVHRAMSHYLQMKSIHPEIIGEQSFEEMVFKADGSVNENSLFIKRSCYIVYIRKWADHFPRKNILILDGDDFKENLFPPLRETETFLQIGHYITPEKFVFNKEKGFYCIKTNSSLVENNIACLGEGKGRKHPQLSTKHEQTLRKYFTRFNKKLFTFLGHRLNWE